MQVDGFDIATANIMQDIESLEFLVCFFSRRGLLTSLTFPGKTQSQGSSFSYCTISWPFPLILRFSLHWQRSRFSTIQPMSGWLHSDTFENAFPEVLNSILHELNLTFPYNRVPISLNRAKTHKNSNISNVLYLVR